MTFLASFLLLHTNLLYKYAKAAFESFCTADGGSAHLLPETIFTQVGITAFYLTQSTGFPSTSFLFQEDLMLIKTNTQSNALATLCRLRGEGGKS